MNENGQLAMTALCAAVADALTDEAWPFEVQHDGTTLQLVAGNGDEIWPCVVRCDDEARTVTAYCILPVSVVPDRRDSVVAALGPINYGLPVACFDIDLGDGEVRCRSGIDVTGTEPDPSLLRRLIAHTIEVTDAWIGRISEIAGAADTPQPRSTTPSSAGPDGGEHTL